jgi:hypothetical protein
MTISVVYRFKVIDIDEEKRKLHFISLRPQEFFFEPLEKKAAIE